MRISDWSSDVCSSDLRLILRGTLLTIAILVVTRLLLAASDRGFRRLFAVGAETRLRFPGLEARANRYLPVLLGTIRVVLYVVAAFAVLQAWGIDTLVWLGSAAGRADRKSVVSGQRGAGRVDLGGPRIIQ